MKRETACTLEAVASFANLKSAARKARRGKSRRPDVEAFFLPEETFLLELREELLNGTYTPGGYRLFEIREPKRRMIAAAPFRDRVLHHALCNFMQPALERSFLARSFSCQRGKGTTAGRECCRKLVNSHRYVLKCDIRKFFPNIDHEILLNQLASRLHCPRVMVLVRLILSSYRTGPEVPPAVFPGDDFLLAADRPRGLPIGNLTSQLWANFHLDKLDHWIAEEQRCGAYLRYTDDFLLFDDNKERLRELRDAIVQKLAALRLKLAEPKSRLLASNEGVPFCGFSFQPGYSPRILGAKKRRFEAKRYSLYRRAKMRDLTQVTFSWYQFSREANSDGLRRAYARWPLDSRLKRRRSRRRSGVARCVVDQQRSRQSAFIEPQ